MLAGQHETYHVDRPHAIPLGLFRAPTTVRMERIAVKVELMDSLPNVFRIVDKDSAHLTVNQLEKHFRHFPRCELSTRHDVPFRCPNWTLPSIGMSTPMPDRIPSGLDTRDVQLFVVPNIQVDVPVCLRHFGKEFAILTVTTVPETRAMTVGSQNEIVPEL